MFIDPTYLRYIVDELNSGTLSRESSTSLPDGLVGVYEEALPPEYDIIRRKFFLDFFSFWALLKKEVSIDFAILLLKDWTEKEVKSFIAFHSKWFNSPQSGLYTLYHEKLRVYILQKSEETTIRVNNQQIIQLCNDALKKRNGDELERYALEFLSTHLLIEAMRDKNQGEFLKSLSYSTDHWNRQVQVSKGFDWSKKMLNEMMLWASKHDDEQVIECALNKVDLYHIEQNDAPRIVEFVAQNDIDTALARIESFGGNDKSGLQRKFILYMLCLMELTFLESNNKSFRKSSIEKLLNHLDENIPLEHKILNWNDFYSSKIIFQMATEWAEMSLDYLRIFKRTDIWKSDWISDEDYFSDNQYQIFFNLLNEISNDEKGKVIVLIDILKAADRQSRSNYINNLILNFLQSINSIEFKELQIDNLIQLLKFSKEINNIRLFDHISNQLCDLIFKENIELEIAKVLVISELLLISSNKEIGKNILLKSIDSAKNIPDNEGLDWGLEPIKVNRLCEISLLLSKYGLFKEAIKILDEMNLIKIPDWYWLTFMFKRIYETKLKISIKNQILSSLEEFIDESKKIISANDYGDATSIYIDSALLGISLGLCHEDKFDLLNQVMNQVSDEFKKSRGWKEICFLMFERGNHSASFVYADNISDVAEKANFMKYYEENRSKLNISEISQYSNRNNEDTLDFLKIFYLQLDNLKLNPNISKKIKNDSLRKISNKFIFNNDFHSYYLLNEILISKLDTEFVIDDFISDQLSVRSSSKKINLDKYLNYLEYVFTPNDLNLLSKIYYKIVQIKIDSAETDQFYAFLNQITEKNVKAKALADIGLYYFNIGDFDKFSDLIQEAFHTIKPAWRLDDIESLIYIHNLVINKNNSIALKILEYAVIQAKKIEPDYDRYLVMPSDRVRSLVHVANVYSDYQQIDVVNNLLEEALENMISFADDPGTKSALEELVISLYNIFSIDKLLESLTRLGDKSIELVINHKAKVNDFEHLLLLLNLIISKESKDNTLASISLHQLKYSSLNHAISWVNQIFDSIIRNNALSNLAVELSRNGRFELAEQVGMDVTDIHTRQECWKSIAKLQNELNDCVTSFSYINKFSIEEAQLFYLFGWVESINPNHLTIDITKKALYLLINSPAITEKLLQFYSQNELFFGSLPKEKINRFNRTLNLQWAIDIKNEISKASAA